MVGRQDDHDVVGRPLDGGRRVGDRGRGVPAGGLAEHVGRIELGQLLEHKRGIASIGDHHDVAGTHERWDDPLERGAEQRPVAEEPQERLRPIGA